MKKFFSLFFVTLLTAPIVFWGIGQLRGNGDNTVLQGCPRPEAALWLDRDYYQAVEDWFADALPAANSLRIFNNWLDYHLFSTTSATDVHLGIHGWLYPEENSQDHAGQPVARQQSYRLLLELHAAEKIISATGRRFMVVVAPGKASVYPEYVGYGRTEARSRFYQALIDANDRHPVSGFVGLDSALKKAKLRGMDVYDKRSRLWTCSGAAAAADQILNVQELATPSSGHPPMIACPPPDDDLYRRVLGMDAQTDAPPAGHTAGPHAVDGPVVVAYGDDYMDRLQPFVTHAFNGMAVIDATQEPTFGRNVLTRDSDWVILESGEGRLERIHLDLEALYATAAGQPLKGVSKRPIRLEGATPVNQCALDITPGGLQIRSSGGEAFFSLPALSGSTRSVFRMVNLTFSPAHQGRITVKTRTGDTGLNQRSLNRETRNMIVPLPFDELVELQINPSEHPGVFILENAELLSFYGKDTPPMSVVAEAPATVGDIYSGMAIESIESPTGGIDSAGPPAMPSAPHPTDVMPGMSLPELTLTDIEQGRIFQRQGKDADIVVTGTYAGLPGPVEARVVEPGTGAVVVPWTVVDGSPENGLYTGILHQVPQGGWYRLEVRSGIAPWVVDKGANRWGVGTLVACIGQSNMREWFYTGSDHRPSPLLMLHRDGEWVAPKTDGNGALALGNRLTAALKIPVGLLDYSVNGTGLTAKADWGRGFWLDTGPDRIYRQIVDGINATGGSVEVVVWMQGEADAARGSVSREEYRAALERLVNDQVRSDIKNGSTRPLLPFLIIPLVKRPTGRDAPCQWIRDAQADALKTIDESHLGALSMDLENRGRQHLTPASYTTLGIRTSQTILYLLGKVSYHRGPTITGVTQSSGRHIDIAIEHRGGTDFTPWSQITGFEVLSAREPLPVATVTRRDGNTIRIVMEDEVPADFKVRYLYGAHPDTSNPVRDNTDLRLPLEPFSQ